MHWVIPFAGALLPAAAEAASSLALPHLEQLLARLTPTSRDEADDLSMSAPHERVLARAWGWPDLADGLLPLAAEAARTDGLAVANDGRGWGLLSPTHWHLGAERVSLTNPAELGLDEADARVLFDALLPLFDGEGESLLWGAPTRWYLLHPRLATLPTASLDRVVGRNVDLWLNTHPDAKLFRRLQAEAQMLLHSHPLNEARESRGQLPVNSFWMSGTGLPQPAAEIPGLVMDDRLRGPALSEDWAAWSEAWVALDQGPMKQALTMAQDADPDQPLALTLCGERHAQRFESAPRTLRQRWFGPRRVAAAALLQSL